MAYVRSRSPFLLVSHGMARLPWAQLGGSALCSLVPELNSKPGAGFKSLLSVLVVEAKLKGLQLPRLCS